MTVQLEMWQLITLLLAFFVCVAGFGKVLFSQIDGRLNQRFKDMEVSRKDSQEHWALRFDELRLASSAETEQRHRVERELLVLRAELPREYIRREDQIRFETTIYAKLDALNQRFDLFTERLRAKES